MIRPNEQIVLRPEDCWDPFPGYLPSGQPEAGFCQLPENEYCGYCGAYHQGLCPRIAEIEYYPNGSIKRVRLHPRAIVPPDNQPPIPWRITC